MASSSGAQQKPFDSLLQPLDKNAEAKREEDIRSRLHEQQGKAQQRLAELISDNSSLPTTLSSVTILNANRTRREFLSRIFNPLLARDNEPPSTLQDTLKDLQKGVDTLTRHDIFESPISIYFDRPDPIEPTTTASDVSAFLSVREKPRMFAQSGVWAGSNDGSLQGSLLFRNIFGGAETFTASASRGTRTRSAYSATFDTPLLSNPDFRFELSGVASSTQKPWSSHDEALKGGNTRVQYTTPSGHRHEISYEGLWRQVTALSEKASPSIRADAGDSFKSAVSHAWTLDRRNNPLLPTRGYLLRTATQLAGLGPLGGDVAFGKLEVESQAVVPLPVGASLTAGIRAGAMLPLPLGQASAPKPSILPDRFSLGGPTDVRGFRIAGLGPRDGNDALGGDVYAAGGASLLLPLPRVGADAPIRLQLFVNGGRCLGLQAPSSSSSEASDKTSLQSPFAPTSSDPSLVARTAPARSALASTVAELGAEMPSVAAGVGLVYAMPVARFELNFSLPLVVRAGEDARKGLSVGVGMSFL